MEVAAWAAVFSPPAILVREPALAAIWETFPAVPAVAAPKVHAARTTVEARSTANLVHMIAVSPAPHASMILPVMNAGLKPALPPDASSVTELVSSARPATPTAMSAAPEPPAARAAEPATIEEALCPPVGDGSILQPELFHTELQGVLTALRDSDKPAVRAFVRDELTPLLENTELLRAYTGLMVGG